MVCRKLWKIETWREDLMRFGGVGVLILTIVISLVFLKKSAFLTQMKILRSSVGSLPNGRNNNNFLTDLKMEKGKKKKNKI